MDVDAATECGNPRHPSVRTRAAAKAAKAAESAKAVNGVSAYFQQDLKVGSLRRDEMYEQFQAWAKVTYGDSGKTKTVTRKKYVRIVKMLRGDDVNSAENSKFRFWVKAKGFRVSAAGRAGDGETAKMKHTLMVPCSRMKKRMDGKEEAVYKKVAVVENFFDIIYNVHVDMETRSGKHAGQKRTYKAISETYAFLPREAVTKFLMQCADCQKRMHQSPSELEAMSAADYDSNSTRSNSSSPGEHQEDSGITDCEYQTPPMDLSVPITTSFLKNGAREDSASCGGSESSGGLGTPRADEDTSPYNAKGGTGTEEEEEEEMMDQGLHSPSEEDGRLYPIVTSLVHQNADHAYDRPLDMSKSETQAHCHVTRAHTRSSAMAAAAAAAAAHTPTNPAPVGVASGAANSPNSKMVAVAWTLPPPPATNGDLRDHHSVTSSSIDMKGLIDHTYDEAGTDANQRKMGSSCDALFRWRPQVVCNGRSSRETSGTPEDLSAGTKDEDEDDEDENDDRIDPHKYDPERLKAFNMFVRLFVDENLDRMVPISKQPKEKIQAIIDSCSRQFPEFSERSRKRIRTYLKSCRRTKRSRDQNGWDLCRPAPPHLTSAMAEQILAAACENETNNAKRMRIGLDPVNINSAHHLDKEHGDQGAASPRQQVTYARNCSSSTNGHAAYRSATSVSANGPLSQHQTTSNNAVSNGPTDLSMKKPSSGMKCSLNPSEVAAVRQLIAGYRESAAFLIRSADELEQLLLQQN